ncbi:MAG: hypothetical protein QHH80_12365, partial [Anaerolineae bacterium]|nr:hypothetical protein [Anaerolineae bacterium]
LVDFAIGFAVLLVLLLAYRVPLSLHALWLPVFLLLGIATALGFGLWTIRMPAPDQPVPRWRYALAMGVAIAPVAVAGMGPLSPATPCILRLWQALLSQSRLGVLVLALAGQMFAMAALLRPGVAPAAARGWLRTGVFAVWGLAALALALWPRGLLLLAGYAANVSRNPLSPGAWAALLLPLLGAMALPEMHDLEDTWQEYGSRGARILDLGWLRSGLLGFGNAVDAAVRGLETLLHGDNYVLWTVALLLGLILALGFL